MGFKVFKVLLLLLVSWFLTVIGGLFLYAYIVYLPAFTDEQCEVVKQNFDKLKVGMTKEEVIPLIGGERKYYVNVYAGQLPGNKPREYETQQKNKKNIWQVWALCDNPNNRDEWLMIVLDTKTNKVVKIFSGDPDLHHFL